MREVVELPQGYTLAEVERLAKCAAGTTLSNPGDTMADRVDDAWSAIVERLYADPTPIEPGQLVWVGRRALYAADRKLKHDYGTFKNDAGNGRGSMPRFQEYWWRPVVTIEDQIVEHRAFAQIWPRLSPAERDAVIAFAIWGDQKLAAQATGVPHLRSNLKNARDRFLRLWHEGEEPSKKWGFDHPGGGRPFPKGHDGRRNLAGCKVNALEDAS